MITISANYDLKWVVKNAPEYQFTSCKKLVNVKRGTIVRKVLNGGSIGYCLRGKFVSLKALKSQIELIKKDKLPF